MPLLYHKDWYISLIIALFLVLSVLVLQRYFSKLKPLRSPSVIAFLIVFGYLTYDNFGWFRDSSCWICLGAPLMIPGLVIASAIAFVFGKGAWQVIHCTEWEVVMYISSFVFYTLLIFGLTKLVSYIKRRLSTPKTTAA